MANTFNTLEEAQAEIIRLNEELEERTTERDSLSQNNTQLASELETVRKLNQTYFNKLSAQYSHEEGEKDDGEEEAQSCEDFAKTLDIF